MTVSDSFREYVLEQLGEGIECRAMFGPDFKVDTAIPVV